MKIAYFDCFSGVSGDMILGALIDAGLDPIIWQKELKKLPIVDKEYQIEIYKTQKVFMEGTKVDIIEKHSDKDNHEMGQKKDENNNSGHFHHHERYLKDILQIIDSSTLNEKIKKISKDIFFKIAKAESTIHNKNINDVHFHELSGIDTIIDVVGSIIGFELLGIDKIYASAIPIGSGFVKAEHGYIPIPAPATIEILKGLPVYSNNIEDEITTPTGAAIIATVAEQVGFMPQMKLVKTGYGAGKKDFKIPNLLRIMVGETIDNLVTKKQLVIETAIDDMNPQIYEYLMQKLFEAGVLDVFYTPIFMKKQRPATLVTILTEPYKKNLVSEIIFKETTSIGYREYFVEKTETERKIFNIDSPWGTVRVKKSTFEGSFNIVPEYEDCKKISQQHNIPLKQVIREIEKIVINSKF
ncbi:MAG: nickel pincer cofactor biosynthesis protein LarC [Candidatus Micrarchaeaceae archaeon]